SCVDESRRYDSRIAHRIRGAGNNRFHSHRRFQDGKRKWIQTTLWIAVSSRGLSLGGRKEDTEEFSRQYLWMLSGLDPGTLRLRCGERVEGKNRRQEGDHGTQRRSRFYGCSNTDSSCRRRPVAWDLRRQWSAAQE